MTGRRETEELVPVTFQAFKADWDRMRELYARVPGASKMLRLLIRAHVKKLDADLASSRPEVELPAES